MHLTAELSLYPLQDDFIPPIDSFIAGLNKLDGLTVITNAMSTQLCGDDELVFSSVRTLLAHSVEQFGRQVLVCKFIPGDLLHNAV